MNNNSNKKYKRPKRRTLATTNPQASKKTKSNDEENEFLQPRCPLLAKDSEWLNVLPTSSADSYKTVENASDEEEVLQLVECEDGPEMKPLTIMFPGLLEKDQKTLEDMLNKTMSTTEVTKHLLGQKADFSLMKKVNRLIPSDKKWLETLSEDSNSVTSEMHYDYGIKLNSRDSRSDQRNDTAENNDNESRINVTASEAHASTSSFQNKF